jgi:Fe2+ transport system protein FeoA
MIPLTQLSPGVTAVIIDIASGEARRDRLASFGLVRGTLVRLLQRRPALVLAVDGTELALDPRIGEEIRVARWK